MFQWVFTRLTGMALVKFHTNVCFGYCFCIDRSDFRDLFDSVDFLSSLLSNSNDLPEALTSARFPVWCELCEEQPSRESRLLTLSSREQEPALPRLIAAFLTLGCESRQKLELLSESSRSLLDFR